MTKMNKNKKKNQNKNIKIKEPKVKQQQQLVMRIPQKKPTISKEMVSKVCGITDPFCVHAGGAKYPDYSAVRTLPYSRRLVTTMTSDASGFCNLIINPQYSFSPFSAANVYVGNDITSWVNFAPYPSLIASVSSYRIVSYGYIIRHIVSPLNSAGMVYVRQYGVENGALIAPINTTTYNATAIANVPVQEAREIAVIAGRTSQMPQNFYSAAADVANVGNGITHGFSFSTIAVAGAPANTPILEVEFVINLELIFEDSSELAQVSTPPPTANSVITSAASHVTSSLFPIFKEGVMAVGRSLVNKASVALAGYLGGPGGAVAAKSALALTVD